MALLWHQYGLTDFNPSNNIFHLVKNDINRRMKNEKLK